MEKLTASLRLAFVLALALPLTSAWAQESRTSKARMEEAQNHFQRGKELYDENDFSAALTEMKRAYEIVPNYRLLYNIGQVSYQLQDYASALRSFSRYLQEGQGEISSSRRDEVQREIDKLRRRVATLRITTRPTQAEISVDDVPVGRTPLSEPVLVNAGRRRVTASLAGHEPVSRVVEVAGQDTLNVDLQFSDAPSDRPVTTRPSDSAVSTSAVEVAKKAEPLPAWVPWGVTGALAVGTAVTGGLAGSASNDLKTKLATLGTTRAELDAAKSRTQSLALVTDILGGVTLVSAGVATFMTLTAPSTPPQRASLQFSVGPSGAAVFGTF